MSINLTGFSILDPKFMQQSMDSLGSGIYAIESIKANPKWWIQLSSVQKGLLEIQLDLMSQYYSILSLRIAHEKEINNV